MQRWVGVLGLIAAGYRYGCQEILRYKILGFLEKVVRG